MAHGFAQGRGQGRPLELEHPWFVLLIACLERVYRVLARLRGPIVKPTAGLGSTHGPAHPEGDVRPRQVAQHPDATHLKESFGFAGEFKHFGTMGKAATIRTMRLENPLEGGRRNELRSENGTTKFFTRSRTWADWSERAPVTQMKALHASLEAAGITKSVRCRKRDRRRRPPATDYSCHS
jgi:hypothetical protein